MKIFLGADHAGFEAKEALKAWLREEGHEVADQGAFTLDPADDYPDFVEMVAKLVAADPESRGVVLGGSGQGEAMCANRIKRVRAAVYYGPPPIATEFDIVKLARAHNNANILSIGSRFVGVEEIKRAVKCWLETPFSGDDRHIRRNTKLDYDLKSELEF